jgi:hypothetical protein
MMLGQICLLRQVHQLGFPGNEAAIALTNSFQHFLNIDDMVLLSASLQRFAEYKAHAVQLSFHPSSGIVSVVYWMFRSPCPTL